MSKTTKIGALVGQVSNIEDFTSVDANGKEFYNYGPYADAGLDAYKEGKKLYDLERKGKQVIAEEKERKAEERRILDEEIEAVKTEARVRLARIEQSRLEEEERAKKRADRPKRDAARRQRQEERAAASRNKGGKQ